MPIDAMKLNTAVNLLKQAVGPQGAFILFTVKPEGENTESIDRRSYGPMTRQVGLLSLAGESAGRALREGYMKAETPKLPEPD